MGIKVNSRNAVPLSKRTKTFTDLVNENTDRNCPSTQKSSHLFLSEETQQQLRNSHQRRKWKTVLKELQEATSEKELNDSSW